MQARQRQVKPDPTAAAPPTSNEGPPMFMPTGGGGKGNRPQSTHQQNHNHQTQHHQASHAHAHSHPHHHHQNQQQPHQQQSRIALLHQQQDPQQQQQQQQASHAVIVPQPSAVSSLGNIHHLPHHPLPQQQLQQHQQQKQQQQHHLQQQQQIIFYASQPPPQLPYASHAPHSSGSSSNGSNGGAALQLSGAASNNSLGHAHPGHGHNHHGHGHGHAHGLTPASSSTNLVRALSNSTLPPHFTPPAGLIASTGGNGGGGSTTFISTAFMPFNHPAQLIGAPSIGFAANGAVGTPTAGFYAAAPQQKQQMPPGQQHGVAVGVGAGAVPSAAQQSIGFYHAALSQAPLNNNNSSASNAVSGGASGNNTHTQRGIMRGGQRSTPPQQQSYYNPYAGSTATPQTRPSLVNNAAAASVTPIMNTRNNALNGSAAFHLQPPTYCPSIPLGPPPSLTTAPMMAAAGMTAQPPAAATALHTYAPHLQTSSASAAAAVAGVAGSTAQQLAGLDKVKERRHAIPIIHPVTQENVLDPNSSVFNKKDSNCTLTASTGSDDSIPPLYQCSSKTDYSPTAAVLVLAGVKVDHQMQTEVASQEPMPLTDEDKVSVIVKDILANSGNPEEHLSFLQFNDVGNAPKNTPELPCSMDNMENFFNDEWPRSTVPVLFQESLKSKGQRPKSANKQSTATPTSIATAVAEAAAGSEKSISIVGSNEKKEPLAKPFELIPLSPSRGQKPKSQTGHKQQPQPQSQSQLPSTSSSASSTPTHQLKTQQQPQLKSTMLQATAALQLSEAAIQSVVAVQPNSMSKKNQRKAQKRKEQEKKKQKVPVATTNPPSMATSNSSTAANSICSSSNISTKSGGATSNPVTIGAATGAESSLIFLTTKTTTGVASVTMDKTMPTTTDKLSATSNKSSISINLRNEQPKDQQHPEDNVELIFDNRDKSMCDLVQSNKHMANVEIMAKFLHNTPSQGDTQLEFLNSSSSVCEEESSFVSEQFIEQPQSNLRERSSEDNNVGELKFGDFAEEATPTYNSSFICSSTWSSTQPVESIDNVDCALKMNDLPSNDSTTSNISDSTGGGSKKVSPTHHPKAAGSKSSGSATASKSTIAVSKLIRYNIEELRGLSKLSDSRKPPLVPCQKGDCIAQLFVSRQSQQQQHHGHHSHNPHGQQFQHTHESMDYMSGKRGRGHGHGPNKKHYDSYQSMGGGISSGNSSSGAGLGNSHQRYMDIIRVQLSLKEEIKLSECENAWQPETLRRITTYTAPKVDKDKGKDNDMDAVLKKVRGILNKLTPDNFEVLLKEMSSINMDTQNKMTNVMLLIFEKTISEPNFAPTYARFCKVLFHEIKAENKSLFTSSLITRIQHEFESNVNDANAKTKKLQPTQERINTCTDAAKKAELRAEMEDLEYQFRRRAWGTVRFIGELFKLQSLTSDRVLHCVESLLEHGCEEKLEYMCKLLTTVGHLLEAGSSEQYQTGTRIEKIFRRIQDIVQRSRTTNSGSHRQNQQNIKISSRVRFMMQDVLDLRARNWDQPVVAAYTAATCSRLQRNKLQADEPKTQHQQQQQHVVRGGHLQQQQKQHHHGHHDSGNYFLQKMTKAQQQENQSLSIDPTKLRFSSSNNDDVTAKLGNSSHYQWRNVGNRPVSSAAAAAAPTTLLKRIHAAPASSFSYPPYQQQAAQPVATPITNSSSNNNADMRHSSDVNFDDKQCQQLLTKLVEEVVSTRSWQGEVLAIWRNSIVKQPEAEAVIHHLLMDYLHRATVKRQQRLACANVFGYLMDQQALDMATFNQAYARFSEEFPDLLVDVPNGWTYVFEFLGPIIHDGHLELKDVWQRRWLEHSQCTERFVRSFVSYFVQEFGARYAHKLWHVDNHLDQGQLFWSDARKYRDFLQANSFQFLEPNSTATARLQLSQMTRTPDEHVERISYLLSLSSDTAIDYINTNVHINTNFVKQLTKFLCCDFALIKSHNNNNSSNNNNNSSSHNHNSNNTGSNKSNVQLQLNVEAFRSHCTPLLRLCLDAKEAHEVACIDETVESLKEYFLVEVEDEMAAGETICGALGVLYDCEVISRDSFDKWMKREIEKSANWKRPLMIKLRALIEEM